MGEPRPGDIPDPTHLKTTNALFNENLIASKGDWAIYDESTNFWTLPVMTAGRVLRNKEALQLQQDINTTGLGDGIANAAAFGNGSWVYALMAGQVLPNKPAFLIVFLDTTVTPNVFRIGFVTALTVNIASITHSAPDSQITTIIPHNLVAGDRVVIAGATTTANNGTFTVTSVVSATAFTVINTLGVPQAGAAGTSSLIASDTTASATFIKRSGDTYAQEGALNEIGVFAMTGLGL